jgi:hypothetical protein
MVSIGFPKSPFGPEDLADWLELNAIQADDNNASAGDLERELKRLGYRDPEGLMGNVFTELDRREKATGGTAYPFNRKNTSIEVKGKSKNYPAYIFCLALSYCRWKARKGTKENPWLLFEELARYSAKNYLGGEAIVFGTSCRSGSGSQRRFEANIDELAKKVGEGERFRAQATLSAKDSKQDQAK